MEAVTAILILAYILCGSLAWGAAIGDLQREEWRGLDTGVELVIATVYFLMGPVGLIAAAFITSGFECGFRFIPRQLAS